MPHTPGGQSSVYTSAEHSEMGVGNTPWPQMWVQIFQDYYLAGFSFSLYLPFSFFDQTFPISSFYTGFVSLLQGDDGPHEPPASELPRNGCYISVSPLCCHMCTSENQAREKKQSSGAFQQKHVSAMLRQDKELTR